MGLRFERALARELKPLGAVHGQWFEFEDANGRGYCQPDLLLFENGHVLVLECKLTETRQGRLQIEGLYRPVLSRAYDRPVLGIVVARHLTRETDISLVRENLALAKIAALTKIPTLHWLGKGPL